MSGMHKPTDGYILDTIAYVSRASCPAKDLLGNSVQVQDTFPYNPESKTAPETAKQWAKGWDYEKKKGKSTTVVKDNKPFSVTITDLDVRSEGGRAYKVIDEEKRRFDLREDQILEVMRHCGVQPRGGINGQFVWGVAGSQVRMVLVGGDLHRQMVETAKAKKDFVQSKKDGRVPTAKTLEAGHIYRKTNQDFVLFMGRVTPPGSQKAFLAFMNLPNGTGKTKWSEVFDANEEFDEDNVDKDYIKQHKKEVEHYRVWDTLSWRERCKFEWLGRWSWSHGEPKGFYPSVMLVSSLPKLESEVGVLETDFFLDLKKNQYLFHEYSSANEYNHLAEHWKYPNGQRADGYGYSSTPSYNTAVQKQQQLSKEALREYRDLLVWS